MRTVPVDDCYIQFLKSNKYLTIATAVAAFYLPVVILCVVYYRIYRETRRHQRKLYELQAFQLVRPHPDGENTAWSGCSNAANERGCLTGCRKRLAYRGLRRSGCCSRAASARCGGSDEVEESFDENTTSGMRDDVQPTSTTMMMCVSQSASGETGQTLVNSISNVVSSVSDVVIYVVNSVSNVVSSVSDVVIYMVNSVSNVVS